MIDLTNTSRYYSPQELPDGVEHLKLPIQGHSCPPQEQLDRIIGAVTAVRQRLGPRAVVGIHCTHGLNRTGFVVAELLCKLEGYQLAEALTDFNTIRSPGLWRENYVQQLHARWGGPFPAIPQPPAWERQHQQ